MRNKKWVRLLAYVTGSVDQELLLQNEYLTAENRILRAKLPLRLRLSDLERATLAEIGKRLGRKALGGRLRRQPRHHLDLVTPGHTPDAISLLDRDHGLLFTGDTYYPGTVWIYRPETDLEAYAASIRRLATLAPQIKTVLGAHNIPVARPSVLPRMINAFEAVRAGKIRATPDSPGKVVYKVDDISFLMRAVESKP
jgi:hypothetical protein